MFASFIRPLLINYFSQSIKNTVLVLDAAVTQSQKAVNPRVRDLSNPKLNLGNSIYFPSALLSVACYSSDSARWKAARPQADGGSKVDLCAALIHILPAMDAGVTPPQQTHADSESQASE